MLNHIWRYRKESSGEAPESCRIFSWRNKTYARVDKTVSLIHTLCDIDEVHCCVLEHALSYCTFDHGHALIPVYVLAAFNQAVLCDAVVAYHAVEKRDLKAENPIGWREVYNRRCLVELVRDTDY